MSKPIKMTDEIYAEIVKEFSEKMKSFKMFDGGISYQTQYTYEGSNKALVKFTPTAWIKMTALIHSFKTEVAWHGFVERDPEDESIFTITDIIVYPQFVAAATVDADEEKYPEWLAGLGMDLNRLRMQGHSHVDMGVSPSGTDLSDQKELLSQIGPNDFYIFMIWNKKFDRTIKIFDLKNNVLYENSDVEVDIVDFDDDIDIFLKEAEKLATKKPYTYGKSTWNSKGNTSSKQATKKKAETTAVTIVEEDDDDYDDYGSPYNYDYYYKKKYRDTYGSYDGFY